MKKYTEEIRVNINITPSQQDRDVYIGKTFTNKRNEKAKCIGVYDISRRSTKRYVMLFEDGRMCYAEGGKIRNGHFRAFEHKPQETPNHNTDIETIEKLQKKIQNLQDSNRILRKIKRKEYREDFIYDQFINQISDLLKQNRGHLICEVPKKENYGNHKVGIIQLSDLHFGKTVDLDINTYNFSVAHERIRKYIEEIVEELYHKNHITNVYLVFTGDIFNLDVHIDQLLSNENNRAENFLKGIDELQYFILTLLQYFNIKVLGVIGNESRIRTTEYNSNINSISSNNFDMLAFQILKRFFSSRKDIEFVNECKTLHDVESINGYNIAFLHGDKLKNHSKDEIVKFKMRLSEEYKLHIDYVMFGHLHETLITPTYARSGSLVGADEYAYNGLNISGSVASQNIYIVDELKDEIRAIAIKLEV